MSMWGGAPSTFNEMVAASNNIAEYMEYLGVDPIVTPTGQTVVNSSVVDWIGHNANYTQWEFNVRPGLKWSDGTNVTSQDILNTYSPNFALNATYDFLNLRLEIQREYIVNSTEAVLVLNKTDAHLPQEMGTLLFTQVYPTSFTQNGASYAGLGTDVGDGPFYVSNYTSGSTQMVMVRNNYYSPVPKICEIVVNLVESESQTSTYVASGLDDLAPIVPSVAAQLLKVPNIQIYSEPNQLVTFLTYNVTWYPYNMTQFRQALAYGINQSQIVQSAFNGYASTGYSSEGQVPTSEPFYNKAQQTYNFDPQKALTLLSGIGIKKGSDGFLQFPNGTDVSLTLWADTGVTSNSIAAGFVQTGLQNLGFKVNLQTSTEGTIIGYFGSNSFNIQHQLDLHTSTGPIFGDPYYDAQPAWDVYSPVTVGSSWEYPPNLNAQFESNLSAIGRTNNLSQEYQLDSNIQVLNAEALPSLILSIPDFLFAYSTARFSGWPASGVSAESIIWNQTAFAYLQPVGTSTSTSSSVLPTSTNTLASSTTSIVTSPTTSSSSTGGSGGLTELSLSAVAMVAVVIIVVASAILATRRRR